MERRLTFIAAVLLLLGAGTACETPPSAVSTAEAQEAGSGEENDEDRGERRPTKVEPATSIELRHQIVSESKQVKVAQVGVEAPDFALTAYHEGAFKQVRLSDYRGQWVLLCFYPGDFTFV